MSIRRIKIFPALYGLARRARLTRQPWFEWVFMRSYDLYKRFSEDPYHGFVAKRPECFSGGHIIDIGANIGYNSALFASVLTTGFKVWAFEPDQENYRMLIKRIAKAGTQEQVVPFMEAMGAADGELPIWHNEMHHANHRVVTAQFKEHLPDGQNITTVRARSVDSFVKQHELHPVSFIKIDVQGYELPVLTGMQDTLATNPNMTVAIEYDPNSISELGFKAEDLKDQLAQWFIYTLRKNGDLQRVTREAIDHACQPRGYADLICTRQELST